VSRRSGPSEARSLDRTAEAMWHTEKAKETHGAPGTTKSEASFSRQRTPVGLPANLCAKHTLADPGKKGLEGSPGRLPHRQVLPLWASVLSSAPLP
jgi:hypothetical protein